MNRKNFFTKNIRVTYCIVILFGFALLFPGAAFQSSFAHPITYDKDNWGKKNFDSSKCTEVIVSADITNLKIIWTKEEVIGKKLLGGKLFIPNTPITWKSDIIVDYGCVKCGKIKKNKVTISSQHSL